MPVFNGEDAGSMSQDEVAATIQAYEALHHQAWLAFQRRGQQVWPLSLICEYDIKYLTATESGVCCGGETYSSRTQSNEEFDFTISYAELTAVLKVC